VGDAGVSRIERWGIPLAALAILTLAAGCSSTTGVRTPSPSATPSASLSASGSAIPCAPTWQLSAALVPAGAAAASTQLAGVAAISSTDVWAVGSSGPAGQAATTLTEHWNGTAWSIVKSPDASNAATLGGDQLTAVAAVSTDDVWAVGDIGTQALDYTSQSQLESSAVQTLIEHWNGTSWSIVDAPDRAPRDGVEPWDVLTSVAAISTDDVWAVGVTEWSVVQGESSLAAQPLVEHWNGTYWSTVTVPDPETGPPDWALTQGATQPANAPPVGSSALLGVTATSAQDVWLVGGYETDMGITGDTPTAWQTLTEHWNGTSWSNVQAPDATLPEQLTDGSNQPDDLLTAAAEAPRGVLWAVGGAMPGSALTLQLGLAFGTSSFTGWHLVPSLAVTAVGYRVGYQSSGSGATSFAPGTSALAGVVTISATDAWAVGAVILHWDGVSWQPMYTVNGEPFDYLSGAAAAGAGGLWAVGGTSIVHATCA
jgi:hypothetical protein